MLIHANVQVKNEALLLEHILPEWDSYPIDHFVFYDDMSTDETVEVISDYLPESRATIYTISSTFDKGEFNEARNRSAMLEYSRDAGADIVVSIDADELLTDPLIDQWDDIMATAMHCKLYAFQWNVVGSMSKYRTDPAYFGNYRDFIFPMQHTGKFDLSQTRYHSPRTPPIDAPNRLLEDQFGFIHLQALNVRFYVLKQLWYKHYEYVNYGKTIEEINLAYDPVVNGLDFNAQDVPEHIIYWDACDPRIFDDIAEQRGYLDYIKKHYVPELVTFGEEYVQ